MTVLCKLCQIRRVYGRFEICLSCRMEERWQDNQERRRRKEVVIRRLGPREVEVALNWERKPA